MCTCLHVYHACALESKQIALVIVIIAFLAMIYDKTGNLFLLREYLSWCMFVSICLARSFLFTMVTWAVHPIIAAAQLAIISSIGLWWSQTPQNRFFFMYIYILKLSAIFVNWDKWLLIIIIYYQWRTLINFVCDTTTRYKNWPLYFNCYDFMRSI